MPLTQTKIENIISTTRGDSARWPTSDRNHGRLHLGTGGRLHIGMHGRLRRNPQWRRRPRRRSHIPAYSYVALRRSGHRTDRANRLYVASLAIHDAEESIAGHGGIR